MNHRIASTPLALGIVFIWCWIVCFGLKAALAGPMGLRIIPDQILAQSAGAAILATLIGSIAWWGQRKKPRTVLFPLLLGTVIAIAAEYGGMR